MSDKELNALTKWMNEVTAILCYQPDIPNQHKVDLDKALLEFGDALGRFNKAKKRQ